MMMVAQQDEWALLQLLEARLAASRRLAAHRSALAELELRGRVGTGAGGGVVLPLSEIADSVLEWLDPTAVGRLACTCRELRELVRSSCHQCCHSHSFVEMGWSGVACSLHTVGTERRCSALGSPALGAFLSSAYRARVFAGGMASLTAPEATDRRATLVSPVLGAPRQGDAGATGARTFVLAVVTSSARARQRSPCGGT